MRFKIMVVLAAVSLMGAYGFAGEHGGMPHSDAEHAKEHGGKEHGGDGLSDEPAKPSPKDVQEIKRQIRLMRAEMAELEEKIAEMTGDHDRVYPKESRD
jgi:TATA-binding protein-associated factor Taf7